MTKLLAHPVTPADVTAALSRIAQVADPEDVNAIRAELARLRRVLYAGDDDDVDYAAAATVAIAAAFASYPGTTRGPHD